MPSAAARIKYIFIFSMKLSCTDLPLGLMSHSRVILRGKEIMQKNSLSFYQPTPQHREYFDFF